MSAVNFNVTLHCRQKGIQVTIETPCLELRSVQEADVEDYKNLLVDSTSYDSIGDIPHVEEIVDRVHDWARCWLKSDPYGAFSIRTKDEKLFLGFISINSTSSGHLALSGACRKKIDGRGYEALTALFAHYLPFLKEYRLKEHPVEIQTTVPLNSFEAKALKSKGFELAGEEVRGNKIWGVFIAKV